MKWLLMFVTLIVLGSCICFFWKVFDRTMAQCDRETPVVQFSIANDCSSNAVLQVISSNLQESIAGVLTDREQIVEREHTRFRAELGTWLSVFGLLTILVTLITPICSLVFQQKEFERIQKLIDEIKTDQERMKITVKQVNAVGEFVGNEKARKEADIQEQHTQQDNQDGLRSLLERFKSIWGKENFDEKIHAGIRLFEECNDTITNTIAKKDCGGLQKCLNIMNNANAYLGMRNLEEFRGDFSLRMQCVRPLKHSNEQVVKALENGGIDGPITGFYKSALNLQGGIPG